MKSILIVSFCIVFAVVTKTHAQWYMQMMNNPNANFFDIQKKIYESYVPKEETGLRGNGEEEDGDFEHFKRWEWYWEPRVDAEGKFTNTSQASLNGMLQLQSGTRTTSGDWSAQGPYDITSVIPGYVKGIGRVNRFTFDNFDRLYAATAGGGLWRKDAEGSWTSLTDNIPVLGLGGVAVDPTNSDIIYILTGDGDASDLPSIGVLKSTDGGYSWHSTGLTFDQTLLITPYQLLINPDNPQVLFAATSNGLYRTDNGGATWLIHLAGTPVFDIEFRPDNTDYIYLSTATDFFRSEDGGITFYGQTVEPMASRCAIAVAPSRPHRVYMMCGRNDFDGDGGTDGFVSFYTSEDDGVTFNITSWEAEEDKNILGRNFSGSDLGVSQANYDLCLAVNPDNADEIFCGGINMWHSTDGGLNWSLASYYELEPGTFADHMHADMHDAQFHNGFLYVSNDGGMNKEDIGAIDPDWDELWQGLNITQVYKLSLDPTENASSNFIGNQDNGEMKFNENSGSTFELIYTGDGGESVTDFTSNDRYYFEGNDDLWRDGCDACFIGGLTNIYSACGCSDTVDYKTAWMGNRDVIIDPDNSEHLYAGWTCMYESNDHGDNWTLQSDFPCNNTTVRTIALGSNTLWVQKSNAVYRRYNNGFAQNVTGNLPVASLFITGLALSNFDNNNRAYVTSGKYYAGNKVFKTVNSGQTWINFSGSLPNVPVNCVVCEPGDDDGVYIGTDIGVFYRNGSTGDWIPFNNGMPSVMVSELEISGDGYLYAATFGRGVWKSPLFGACPNSVNLVYIPGLSDPLIWAYHKYEATDTVFINEPVDRGIGQNLVLQAGDYVRMSEGFEAGNGSEFTATLGDCIYQSGNQKASGGYFIDDGNSSQQQNQEYSVVEDLAVVPNPISDEGLITFSLPQEENISISLFDMQGKFLSTVLPSTHFFAGHFESKLDLRKFPPGVYTVVVSDGITQRNAEVVKVK